MTPFIDVICLIVSDTKDDQALDLRGKSTKNTTASSKRGTKFTNDAQVTRNVRSVSTLTKANVKRMVDARCVHSVTKLDVKLVQSLEKALFMRVQRIPDHAKTKVLDRMNKRLARVFYTD